MKNVYENLLKKMESKKLNKHSLSIKSGLSSGAVKQIFSTKSAPRFDSIIKISQTLECSIDWLVYGDNPPNFLQNTASPIPTEQSQAEKQETEGLPRKKFTRKIMENAVVAVDEMLFEKKIILSSEKRALAYFLWCEFQLWDQEDNNTEKFETIIRAIR